MDRLRVIDASVMPTIASGNINPAVLMIGEKGAELVRGRMTAVHASTASSNGAGVLDRVVPSRVRDLLSDVATVVRSVPGGSG